MEKFGVTPAAIISKKQETAILDHFRGLGWIDLLTDMYLCVEALERNTGRINHRM